MNDNLIDFTDDLDKVLMRKFSMQLPVQIKSKIDDFSQDSPDSLLVPNNGKKRRLDTSSKIANRQVKNPLTLEEWIFKSADDYTRTFKDSSLMSERPWLNGAIMCHRWHSKGYCFDDCNKIASHIPSDQVPEAIKKEYTEWKDAHNKKKPGKWLLVQETSNLLRTNLQWKNNSAVPDLVRRSSSLNVTPSTKVKSSNETISSFEAKTKEIQPFESTILPPKVQYSPTRALQLMRQLNLLL